MKSGASQVKKWTLNETIENDLIDENELLSMDDIQVKKVSGCDESAPSEPGSRRACKNCSCGLAEEEEKAALSGLDPSSVTKTEDMKSSCGNCSKGDAFRCSSCPYLGKPVIQANLCV